MVLPRAQGSALARRRSSIVPANAGNCSSEQAVVGETPNLAARLQALAEPGAVIISVGTRQLTAGLFEYCDLGRVPLKGFAETVPAWQVLGTGAAESRFEALRATTTPLIGRDEEIDLLMRRWQRARDK
jgi:class 3 adenylate cyclase